MFFLFVCLLFNLFYNGQWQAFCQLASNRLNKAFIVFIKQISFVPFFGETKVFAKTLRLVCIFYFVENGALVLCQDKELNEM